LKIFCNFTLTLIISLLFNFNLDGQQIFSDDFESGFESSEWDIYFAGEDTLETFEMMFVPNPLPSGGDFVGYLQDWDGSNTGAALAIAGTTDLHNYSIEGDVYCYVDHQSGISAYTGIVVYADSSIDTYIKMVADFDSNQRIRLYNNHLNTITFEYTFSHDFTAIDIPGGIPTIDGWHKMKIEVRTLNPDTTAFWCYFDDQLLVGCPIYDIGEDRIGSGLFGLFSFQQDDDGIEGFYDNIVVNSLITSVEENLNVTPNDYSLKQNYPNPFNPSTVIEFSLPDNVGNVKLSIYNAFGEKVAELVNTSLNAGKYQYQWNAQNVATGMYIYELRTENYLSVKKMILIK
jgi:hypothetical protein